MKPRHKSNIRERSKTANSTDVTHSLCCSAVTKHWCYSLPVLQCSHKALMLLTPCAAMQSQSTDVTHSLWCNAVTKHWCYSLPVLQCSHKALMLLTPCAAMQSQSTDVTHSLCCSAVTNTQQVGKPGLACGYMPEQYFFFSLCGVEQWGLVGGGGGVCVYLHSCVSLLSCCSGTPNKIHPYRLFPSYFNSVNL